MLFRAVPDAFPALHNSSEFWSTIPRRLDQNILIGQGWLIESCGILLACLSTQPLEPGGP
jgi:hypothetical protein